MLHFLCLLYLICAIVFWVRVLSSPERSTQGWHVTGWYVLPPIIALVGLAS